MNRQTNLEKEESIRKWVSTVRKVYSLSAIQQHFYKVRLMELEQAKTQKDIDHITNGIDEILYVFEIAFEGDYTEVAKYYDVMCDQCKHYAAAYAKQLYNDVTQLNAKDLNKHVSLFKPLTASNEYSSIL